LAGGDSLTSVFFFELFVVHGGALELSLVSEAAPVVVACTRLAERWVKT